ncbi:MAG: hypothetical protein KJO35_10360, partial [Gammaproteobacteria bacterium]|nr:hypothetical protein [Gammaproteobacteria bacterium]
MNRLFAFALIALPVQTFAGTVPFINEFHYDNVGTDTGEGVEIAGMAGTALEGWSVLFYNGSSGTIYKTLELGGVIPDQSGGYGALYFDSGALQNGAPDGMVLLSAEGEVLQFLSYEGVFTATEGPANALTSDDVGLSESSATEAGWSLQLTGTGRDAFDFGWSAGPASYGQINPGQQISAVPVPAGLPLLFSG